MIDICAAGFPEDSMFKPGAERGGGYRSEGPYEAPKPRAPETERAPSDYETHSLLDLFPSESLVPAELKSAAPDELESVAPDKVERIQAKQIDVSAGRLRDDGRVVVERRTLGPDTRKVVIGRAAGMQIGEHNRQFNVHSYEVVEPTVSLDHLLDGHPLRQWAFEKVVANPDSSLANYFFRVFLPGEPVFSGGRIALPEMRGRPISAQLGPSGEIVLDRAWGAQVGDWNTQRNRFSYSLEGPELSLSEALRD